MISERLGADGRQPRRRARLERRLPAPALPAQGHSGAGDRSGRQRRPCGGGARRADARRVLRRPTSPGGSAAEGRRADLVLGNNVLAQVPDLNDFVEGVRILLAPGGTATFEFPHLARLIEGLQYDTIYHEHFSYFSLFTVREVFAAHGLAVVDVEELPTHGGSLRVYAAHERRSETANRGGRGAARPRGVGGATGSGLLPALRRAGQGVEADAAELLIELRRRGQAGRRLRGAGQGQHAAQLLRHPHGLPRLHGRSQPVQARALHARHAHPDPAPERIAETRPDAIVILPWNLAPEISAQLAYTAEWGAVLIVPIPVAQVIRAGIARTRLTRPLLSSSVSHRAAD